MACLGSDVVLLVFRYPIVQWPLAVLASTTDELCCEKAVQVVEMRKAADALTAVHRILWTAAGRTAYGGLGKSGRWVGG